MESIRQAASDAEFFVFNGDIFDFKWSILASAEETAKTAIEWFDKLCTDFPECRFYYILGNHDCHIKLLEHLEALAEKQPNFYWHDAYLKIETLLIFHGDLVFNKNNGTLFKRNTFMQKNQKATAFGKIYHFIIKLGAHTLIKHIYTKEKYASHVTQAIKNAPRKHLDGIKDIYLGHTHVAFSGFEYKGITFHNTGSAVHDLHCNMLKVPLQ